MILPWQKKKLKVARFILSNHAKCGHERTPEWDEFCIYAYRTLPWQYFVSKG